MGLDALNPMEVKAGMDPLHMKRTYRARPGAARRLQRPQLERLA